jgi:hemolysin III
MGKSMSSIAPYSPREEFANALTHGVGFLVAVAALIYMIDVTPVEHSVRQKAGVVVYGVSLILMFLTSTLYHAVSHPGAKQVLKRFDHCAIYLLIAGSYTPFLLVAMRTDTGWWLFGTVWAIATAGIIKKHWFRHRFPKISLAIYLAMGWLIVVAAPQLADAIGPNGMKWLIGGGLFYSVGAIFFAM